jgi:heat shock protein HslJ
MIKIAHVCLTLSVITLSACQTTPRPASASLIDTQWQLTQVDQYAVATLSDATRQPYLFIKGDDYLVSGMGGCNRIGGTYQQQKQEITFNLFSTKRACTDDQGQEQKFLQHLNDTRRYYIKGSQLFLIGQDQKVHLVFQARPTAPTL